jgi:hypothetical protein
VSLRWFNFDCADAEGLYSLNDQLGQVSDDLATYGAESQSVPTYQSGNANPAASYQAAGKASAPKTVATQKKSQGKHNQVSV